MISKGWQFALLSAWLASPPAFAADDTLEQRMAAAQRYLKVQPVSDNVEKMLPWTALRQPVPPEKKEQFIADIRREVRMDALEKGAQKELAEKFTVAELDVLAGFFGSADGVSAIKKMDRYIGTMTSELMAELLRASKCLDEAMKNPGTVVCGKNSEPAATGVPANGSEG